MTEDVAKHFSTVPHTQGGTAPEQEHLKAKDELDVKNEGVTWEDAFFFFFLNDLI